MYITIKGNRAEREITNVYNTDYTDIKNARARRFLRRQGYGKKEHLRTMEGEFKGWVQFEDTMLVRLGSEPITKSDGKVRCKGDSRHYIKNGEDAICVANSMHFCRKCVSKVRTVKEVVAWYSNTDNYAELEVIAGKDNMPFDQWVNSVSC